MKLPNQFYRPLAIGAPAPFREPPVKVERMIHFVPAHNEKLRSRVGDMAKTVDVILANLKFVITVASIPISIKPTAIIIATIAIAITPIISITAIVSIISTTPFTSVIARFAATFPIS